MAKSKVKAAKPSGPPGQADVADDLPVFDEKALASLTAKIERYRKTTEPDAKPSTKNAKKQKSQQKANPEKARKVGVSNGPVSMGKKRDSQGNVKGSPSGASAPADETKAKRQHTADADALMQEVLTLGGDEDDLKLIQGVETDDEDAISEGGPNGQAVTADFRKELSSFAASLGIGGDGFQNEPQSEDESEEWDDASVQSEVAPPKAAPKAAPKEVQATSRQGIAAAPQQNGQNRLMFEARPDWHAAELPKLPDADVSDVAVRHDLIATFKRHAISLLEKDSELYASKHLSSTSSHRFLSTIMSSGTLSDKISALTLVVQESPVHTVKSFESLTALAQKRSRGQAVTALGAIKDLLGVGTLLPADRRLRTFESQPGLLGALHASKTKDWSPGSPLPGSLTNAHLISWAYEDWLKTAYFEVLKILETWCNDEVEYARTRALTYVYELLREKPEQEANLLRLLVNKLGDPDKKIASRASFLLLQLETTHPLMKPIIIHSVENEVLLRPGQNSHARYYAINTLNQTILSVKEEEVAHKLLAIYFSLFVVLLKSPQAPKPVEGPQINKKGQVQGGGGPMGKKAMAKAKAKEAAKEASEETTEKLISAILTGVNRALPFAKSDDETLDKHMDMLFKITHSSNFNTSIQALMLIQQLSTSRHVAEERFFRTLYESLLDPRLVTSSKHALYLNLLFRSLKADLNVKRVKAFVKRLVQVITLHQPPFVCGVLYLLKELETAFQGLRTLLQDPEEWDDAEEVFKDVVEDDADVMQTVGNDEDLVSGAKKSSVDAFKYDGRKRDPEHSNADKSCLWELLPFINHFHPSVTMFATRLLNGEDIPAKPDLATHSLIHFLDRFVYRNPKAPRTNLRGTSIMQPLAGGERHDVVVSNSAVQRKVEPVNSESFWRKKAEDVAVDEAFFHIYFNQVAKGKQSGKKEKPAKHAEEDGEENGDDDEDEVWQALVESRPEIEGGSEGDSDLDLGLDDLESDYSDDDDDDMDVDVEDDDVSAIVESDGAPELGDDDDQSDMDALFEKEAASNSKPEAVEEDNKSRRAQRKRLKNLPVFASVDDYAQMIEDNEGED